MTKIEDKELDSINDAIGFIANHSDGADDHSPFEKMMGNLRDLWNKGRADKHEEFGCDYFNLRSGICPICGQKKPKKAIVIPRKITTFNASTFKPDLKPEKKEKKKPKRIAPMSEKRKKENKEYLILREEFLKGKVCPITKQKAVDVHHTYSGKDRNKYFLDVSTWIAVSRKGHSWIHDFPKEARALGYLK